MESDFFQAETRMNLLGKFLVKKNHQLSAIVIGGDERTVGSL